MTDTQNNPGDAPNEDRPAPPLPLGYWLRAVDAMIGREFVTALAAEDVDRRDWMLLNAVSGDVDVPAWLASRTHGRGGKRLRALAERGWVARTEDSWTLTDEGRAAKARLTGMVDGIRERVSGAVSPADYATMTASLEAIARELGWNESERMPRGGRRRGRHGFGRETVPGFRPGFGRAFGPRDGHPGTHEHCGPREHGRGDRRRAHGELRDERHAERAFERGYEAGFEGGYARARDIPAA